MGKEKAKNFAQQAQPKILLPYTPQNFERVGQPVGVNCMCHLAPKKPLVVRGQEQKEGDRNANWLSGRRDFTL